MDDLSRLVALLGLPPIDWVAPGSVDWPAAEAALGIELPGDYKRFADAYGPGIAAADHPVVLREHGPYFERFEAGFAATLTGLLTGAIRSEYLSRWLQAPHSYNLAGRRA